MGVKRKSDHKRDLLDEAARLGSTLVGFAPVTRWAEAGEVPPAYRPDAIWHMAKTVIVVGVPMLLPIVELSAKVHPPPVPLKASMEITAIYEALTSGGM